MKIKQIYDGEAVHMGTQNGRTGRIGDVYTPTADISTICRTEWEVRPRRTLRKDLVTCPECAALLGAGDGDSVRCEPRTLG